MMYAGGDEVEIIDHYLVCHDASTSVHSETWGGHRYIELDPTYWDNPWFYEAQILHVGE